jgi:hypothetical protein
MNTAGKGREFLDYLGDCQLLKKDSAPCSQSVSQSVSDVLQIHFSRHRLTSTVCTVNARTSTAGTAEGKSVRTMASG